MDDKLKIIILLLNKNDCMLYLIYKMQTVLKQRDKLCHSYRVMKNSPRDEKTE